MTHLTGKTVAFLMTDGFEDSEFTEPWKAVTEHGAEALLVSPKTGELEGKNGYRQQVDRQVADVVPDQFDALVLPGGVVNGDNLRTDQDSVDFVRGFFEQHKPVGVICHGPWILIEAGVVDGRTITSYPSLTTDLRNAGANWVDEEVVVDEGLVSSRNPDDLPAFCAKVVEEIAEGKHAEQRA
ncbi:MAG TPA: type 1 glutamine amidotransferase domain-containing protein [Protaetiibacter sp.]|nr:type 1 glutamine amidotransferase domain-containing protein [Protaetiibacter sp.]